jgi:hypothetical protein
MCGVGLQWGQWHIQFHDKIEWPWSVASVETALNRNRKGQASEHVQLSGGHFVVVLKRTNMEHELIEEDSVRQTAFQGTSERSLPKMFPIAVCEIHDMPRFGSPSRAPRLLPFLVRCAFSGQIIGWYVLGVGDGVITIKICIPRYGMVEPSRKERASCARFGLLSTAASFRNLRQCLGLILHPVLYIVQIDLTTI